MRPRLWTPTFVGLALATFCSAMIFYLLVPTMATHALDAFGAGPAAAGALASIFFIGALIARGVSGGLIDRFGVRRVALVAAVWYVATTAAYLPAPSYEATFVVRLLNGTGFGLFSSAVVTGAMLTLPPTRRAEGAGWLGVGVSLAIGLGPFVSLSVVHGPWGMGGVFAAATACAALALALVAALGRGLPGSPVAAADPGRPALRGWRTLLDRRAVGIGVVVMLGAFAYSAILAFLDPATTGTPLKPAASVFFLVYAGVVLVARPVGGRLQDRFGERAVLLPATVLLVVAMALVATLASGWVLLAGAVVLGFGWGTMTSGGQAAAVSRVPNERTGAAIATYFFLLDLGTGVGPIVLGALVPAVGYQGAFAAALLAAVGSVAAYGVELLRARRAPRPGRP